MAGSAERAGIAAMIVASMSATTSSRSASIRSAISAMRSKTLITASVPLHMSGAQVWASQHGQTTTPCVSWLHGRASRRETAVRTDFDVLIIGAGISGIGAACHLKTRLPDKTFAILEARDSIGGTWDRLRYP